MTRRSDLLAVLRTACAATPLHGLPSTTLTAVADLGEAHTYVGQASLLVVDMGFCVNDPDLLQFLEIWRSINPVCLIVYILLSEPTRDDGRRIMQIGGRVGFRDGDAMLYVEEALSPSKWVNRLMENPTSRVIRAIRADFEERLPADLPNRGLLLQMLTSASSSECTVKNVAGQLAPPDLADATKRRKLNQTLRDSGQPVASEVLTGFRVSIHSRLLELGQTNRRYWSPTRRAQVLGAPNAKALRRSLVRCSGLEYDALRTVSYTVAAETCETFLRPNHDEVTRTYGAALRLVLAKHAKVKDLAELLGQ